MPIALSDVEMDILMHAAAPLDVRVRGDFLKAVAAALAGETIGPGSVYRICREQQKRFFEAPAIGGMIGAPKHDRRKPRQRDATISS